jgi:hypothetical protein
MQTGTVDGLPQELMPGRRATGQQTTKPGAVSAVFNPAAERPRLVLAASADECRVGGVIVTKP